MVGDRLGQNGFAQYSGQRTAPNACTTNYITRSLWNKRKLYVRACKHQFNLFNLLYTGEWVDVNSE